VRWGAGPFCLGLPCHLSTTPQPNPTRRRAVPEPG
jgi:hypothetical protein